MKSRSSNAFQKELLLEKNRKEFHDLQRRLVALEHELNDMCEEMEEFDGFYNEHLAQRFAELESLEKGIGGARCDHSLGSGWWKGYRRESRLLTESFEVKPFRQAPLRSNAAQGESLKDLYRRVAKTIHPDLALHEGERERRQELMAEANRAYADEDHVTLMSIIHEWELHGDSSGEKWSELALLGQRIRDVNEQTRLVDADIIRVKNSDFYRLARQYRQAKWQGRDVLPEMKAKLEADILAACKRHNESKKADNDDPISSERVRIISFPTAKAIGSVFIRNKGSRNFLDWSKIGEATGNVALPAGKSVRLDLEAGLAAGLEEVSGLAPDALQSCYMYGATNADLVHILRFTGMEELYLSGSGITGEGLMHLLELVNLERLYLYDTSIDDQGIRCIKYISRLRYLTVCNGRITEAGLNLLRKTMPSCSIVNLSRNK